MNTTIRDSLIVSFAAISTIALCAIAARNEEKPTHWLLYKMSVNQGGNALVKIPFYSYKSCAYAITHLNNVPPFNGPYAVKVGSTCVPSVNVR